MTNEELLCGTVLASWKQVMGRLDKAVAAMTEEQAERRVAAGKNRLRYLVGHLAVVHDMLVAALGIGERTLNGLDEAYLKNPDGAVADPVPFAEVKAALLEVNGRLTEALAAWAPGQWLERHGSVSAEDFAKEPLRNRLAMVLSRTNHASFHLGQMVLVK